MLYVHNLSINKKYSDGYKTEQYEMVRREVNDIRKKISYDSGR